LDKTCWNALETPKFPRAKKLKNFHCNGKFMLYVLWNAGGAINIELMPRGTTENANSHMLRGLLGAFRSKSLEVSDTWCDISAQQCNTTQGTSDTRFVAVALLESSGTPTL
jgi:hypothetical protein